MQDFITILFFITSIILFLINIKKKYKINEINKNIEIENEKLLKDKENIIKEINFLNEKRKEDNVYLQEIEKLTNNMSAAARSAFEKYEISLNNEYQTLEKE